MMNPNPRQIPIADFTYELPEDRIAAYPPEQRGESRLLVYKDEQISESTYGQIAEQLPAGSLLVFNNTRVVQARLRFSKPTGGAIEIFCLEPDDRYPDISTAMAETGGVSWNCLVGGAGKWKPGLTLEKWLQNGPEKILLQASMDARRADGFTIRFSWTPIGKSFAEILQLAGKIPIPPYIKREADETDTQRYQTIYAAAEGSVAAPTAGLHFTPAIFADLEKHGISKAFLTLHVGAGTFKPVKSERMEGHDMHAEFIDVNRATLNQLISHHEQLIAVGTTSLRTLESLYWMGVKATLKPDADLGELAIRQWEVYDDLLRLNISVITALNSLAGWMDNRKMNRIICKTQILIAPGYSIKMVRALVTNFHQPQSTLLLLVAALIGKDWKKVYEYALQHHFRFLSYGDGSLLWLRETSEQEVA